MWRARETEYILQQLSLVCTPEERTKIAQVFFLAVEYSTKRRACDGIEVQGIDKQHMCNCILRMTVDVVYILQ